MVNRTIEIIEKEPALRRRRSILYDKLYDKYMRGTYTRNGGKRVMSILVKEANRKSGLTLPKSDRSEAISILVKDFEDKMY